MMTYYDVLGIDHNADQAAIKKAYRKQMREVHPDVNSHSSDNHIIEIQQAYEVLKDPTQRTAYDVRINLGEFFTIEGLGMKSPVSEPIRVRVTLPAHIAKQGGYVDVKVPHSPIHEILTLRVPPKTQDQDEITLPYREEQAVIVIISVERK